MRTNSLRALTVFVALIAACLAVAERHAVAQEGYPLAGTWYGEYSAGNTKNDLTVIMKWDGKSVTGLINPGPNAKPITSAVMDITPGKPAPQGQQSTQGTPPVFRVRFEVDGIAFDGTIKNPVAGNRTIVGTWKRGNESGPFQIRRL